MPSIEIKTISLRHTARGHVVRCAGRIRDLQSVHADALSTGTKNYKPFAVEHIGMALAGAKELQAAVKANNVKKAQAAWIKSREGWEAAEPVNGQFFEQLDAAIDAWPDAKHGYHAIEARLFVGKLAGLNKPVAGLVANLAAFQKKLSPADFEPGPQGLLNGAASVAYEIGENKSMGGGRLTSARRSSTCTRTSRASRRCESWCSRTP